MPTSFFRALFVGALALLSALSSAQASEWRVDAGRSSLAFTYLEDGEPAFGRFERFDGSGAFDASAPRKARLDLTIDIDSIKLKDVIRSSLVKTETWFDAENVPQARFQLKNLTPLKKAGVYRAEGVLTIKNFSRRVRPVVALDVDKNTARARGRISFKRSHFRVGDPTLSLFVEVSDEITVDFDLRARRR